MTLKDIEAMEKEFLLAEDICEFLGVNAQSLRSQTQDDPSKLGFPAIVIGNRVKYPKAGFVDFMRHGRRA